MPLKKPSWNPRPGTVLSCENLTWQYILINYLPLVFPLNVLIAKVFFQLPVKTSEAMQCI